MDNQQKTLEVSPRLETQHSMLRRCTNWDYRGRGIYMFTLTTIDRTPLLGELKGKVENAYIELTDIGKKAASSVEEIASFYPQIRVLCKQVMPDHIHFLLFVEEPLPVHIGKVIRGFKIGTTRDYKSRAQNTDDHTKQEVLCARHFQCRETLWNEGYHDRILFHDGQLDTMIRYIKDNPRRLWLKRANPDLFRIHQQTPIAGVTCTTLGNMFLYEHPLKAPLQCSRTLTQTEIDTRKNECLAQAANGTVFVSPAVSEGEKQICRALREAGYPLIILLENGFPSPDSPHYRYFKPSGVYFEACAAGKLLLIEPSPALFDRPDIEAAVYAKTGIPDLPHDAKRYRFVALNALAADIASYILA